MFQYLVAFLLFLIMFPAQSAFNGGRSGTVASASASNCAVAGCSDNFAGSALSSNWTTVWGVFQVSGGAFNAFDNDNESFALYNAGAFTPNQHSCVTMATVGNMSRGGASVRMSGTAGAVNAYFLWWDLGVGMVVDKIVAGNETQFTVFDVEPDITAGHVACISVTGSTITVTDNGTLLGTLTDTDLTSGNPGIYGNGGTNDSSGSNWTGGNN
jgi:hypothetical protein